MASRLSRKALAIGAFSLLAAQHVAAECNLNFTLLSRMTSTSLVGSIEYTVHGWGNDPDSDCEDALSLWQHMTLIDFPSSLGR